MMGKMRSGFLISSIVAFLCVQGANRAKAQTGDQSLAKSSDSLAATNHCRVPRANLWPVDILEVPLPDSGPDMILYQSMAYHSQTSCQINVHRDGKVDHTESRYGHFPSCVFRQFTVPKWKADRIFDEFQKSWPFTQTKLLPAKNGSSGHRSCITHRGIRSPALEGCMGNRVVRSLTKDIEALH